MAYGLGYITTARQNIHIWTQGPFIRFFSHNQIIITIKIITRTHWLAYLKLNALFSHIFKAQQWNKL